MGRGSSPGYRPQSCGDRADVLPASVDGVVVTVGCTCLQMWRGGVPWALQVRVLRAPAAAGRAAVPDLPRISAGVRTKEVRGLRGGPGSLEGGGPGLRLLVLGVPPRGARGDVGPLSEQGTGPGSLVW